MSRGTPSPWGWISRSPGLLAAILNTTSQVTVYPLSGRAMPVWTLSLKDMTLIRERERERASEREREKREESFIRNCSKRFPYPGPRAPPAYRVGITERWGYLQIHTKIHSDCCGLHTWRTRYLGRRRRSRTSTSCNRSVRFVCSQAVHRSLQVHPASTGGAGACVSGTSTLYSSTH